ncbi:JmjC domain-containing protein [Trujillonella humicola]|uniref:JmjC domain-containing protein n=1 Tax=Trujillonella humicola TaxID=3383699 RepID=UPI0039058968
MLDLLASSAAEVGLGRLAASIARDLRLDSTHDERTRSADLRGSEHQELVPCLAAAAFEAVSTPGALASNMRLLDEGREVGAPTWVASRIDGDQVIHTQIRAGAIERALAAGHMLVVDSADDRHPWLMALREGLEYALRARSWINIYTTAGFGSTFGEHRDTMPTLIFQVFGRRRWLVADAPGGSPPVRQELRTHDLVPGEILYVPALTTHDVVAVGELSVHLTIGFDRSCGLSQQLDQLGRWVGRPLPALDDQELARGRAMLPARRAGSSLPFAVTHNLAHVRSVRWASRLPPILETDEMGACRALSLGKEHELPGWAAPALKLLARGSAHSIGDLMAEGRLSEPQTRELLVMLVDRQLVIASCGGPPNA